MPAKAYQTLSDEFVAQVNAAGDDGLDPFNLCKIAAWKSAISVAAVTVNPPDVIRHVTAESRRALRDWLDRDLVSLARTSGVDWDRYEIAVRTAMGSKRKRTGLMQLEGIRYPAASAILRVWNRKAFPVIDRHAVRAVRTLCGINFDPNTGAGYTAYAQALAETARFRPRTEPDDIHARDQEAMNRGRDLPR